jgi:hypothetical protein
MASVIDHARMDYRVPRYETPSEEVLRLRRLVKAQKVEIELLKALDKSQKAQLDAFLKR